MCNIPEELINKWYGGFRDDGSVLCVFNFRSFMGQITLQKLNPETHNYLDAESLKYYADFMNQRQRFSSAMTIEQAQSAALAWARSVLGKALVEAGADVVELWACEKHGATKRLKPFGDKCPECFASGEENALRPAKHARVEGA